MKKLALVLILASTAPLLAQQPMMSDVNRWKQQAAGITITRDDWGIAHVHGKTDADAVFGMVYAQAEDDFNRVETNYINGLGRLAEAEGEAEIWRDLRMKLFIDPDTLKKEYSESPAWLQKLMNAWADGLNYYEYTHPNVKPRVITHFEPWMALCFTEGSIGGDIERVNLPQLQAFYGAPAASRAAELGSIHYDLDDKDSLDKEPSGSNGIAIGPQITTTHHAMLLINPHTSFFFRSELQMTSDEGLNAYGAATWGQFFLYQGFNERAGWMHTTSGANDASNYLETVTKKGDQYFYKFGDAERPVVSYTITVPYKTATGMAKREFTVYRTQHGPVVREQNGKWVSYKIMVEHVKALTQSYVRTKAHTLKEFEKSMELHTNSSNNTLFADADGNFAFLYGNFVPKRDPRFDWSKPVDGSDPATEWQGLFSFEQSPNSINPPDGWAYNSNNWPWSTSGPDSPKQSDYPDYIENGKSESPRGKHAVLLLSNKKDFTLDGLLKAAFDSYMPSFAELIPVLVKAYDDAPAGDPDKAKVADQIAILRGWDYRWGASSVATSLAVYYSEARNRIGGGRGRRGGGGADSARTPTGAQLLQALAAGSDKLTSDFGSWRTPWGDINRFQRINDDITPSFDDAKPSIPVMFTSANWGSLASFGARQYPNTKKWYGTSGNSFVAVVEFGDSVHARAVTAGGESGAIGTKHFNDEAERYATGNLRTVYFYPSQLKGHTEKVYHPGE